MTIEYKGVSIDPVKVLRLMEKQRDAMEVFYEYLSGGRTGPDEDFNEYDMEEIHIMALNALINSEFKDRLMKYATSGFMLWICWTSRISRNTTRKCTESLKTNTKSGFNSCSLLFPI